MHPRLIHRAFDFMFHPSLKVAWAGLPLFCLSLLHATRVDLNALAVAWSTICTRER